MPELSPGETLQDIWEELGFISRAGDGGIAPLTFAEMQAYRDLTGVKVAPEAWRVIAEMSRAFVAATQDSNPLSIPPMERSQHD